MEILSHVLGVLVALVVIPLALITVVGPILAVGHFSYETAQELTGKRKDEAPGLGTIVLTVIIFLVAIRFAGGGDMNGPPEW